MDDKVKQENGITDADVKAEIAKQQEEEQQQPAAATSQVGAEQEETKPLSDGDKEEKVVQDAVKQISFYLSDSNLPYDKFLFTQAQKSLASKDAPIGTGWIPLSTILSFKRMQEILARSSRSYTICEFAIVNALRSAYPADDASALLEVSASGDEIRRKRELVPPSQTGQMDRSVYAKGFPNEEEEGQGESSKAEGSAGSSSNKGKRDYAPSQLQKKLEDFFASLNLGKVNAVRMRRDDSKKFKGSVFVEFATLESAKAFLELDPKPTYPGQGEPLETMSKKEYIDMKAKEKGIAPVYAANKDAQRNNNNAGDNNKRPFNAFRDWNKIGTDSFSNGNKRSRRDGDDKGEGSSSRRSVTVFVEGKEMEVDPSSGRIKNPEEIEFTSRKVARFEGASTSDDSNPVQLKNNLQSIHPAVYVDFERGNSSGVVFFKEPIDENKFEALKTSKLTLGGDDNLLTWTLIEGEEEKKFHVERAHKRASIALADHQSGASNNRNNDRRNNNSSRDGRDDRRGGGGGGRGRGGRGGRGGGRGGRRGDDDRRRNNGGERERNDRKRERDDGNSNSSPVKKEEDSSKPKGNAISVPQVDSAGPEAKRVKTE